MMALLHDLTEGLALRMLAREGVAIIWQLHLAATQAQWVCKRGGFDFGNSRCR
jgi:hypothetical protein